MRFVQTVVLLVASVATLPASAQTSARKDVREAGQTRSTDPRLSGTPLQQTVQPVQSVSSGTSAPAGGISVADYTFGPNDVLNVQIVNSPEYSGTFQVTNTGFIAMPSVGLIKAAGLKSDELSKAIADTYREKDLLQHAIVTIFIQQYHSRQVLVLGAVTHPSAYALEKRTTLLEVISMAGGLAPNAGDEVTITHQNTNPDNVIPSSATPSSTTSNSADPSGANASSKTPPSTTSTSESPTSAAPTLSNASVVTIRLSQISSGRESNSNLEVQAGDVVNVGVAPVVYVVGAVTKPGGFVLEDPASGTSVLQAIALAEGLTPTAAKKRAIVLRRNSDAKNRQEIPVNLSSLMSGKGTDQVLLANDILFIPDSNTKKTFREMGKMAETAAVGVTTYGLGFRLGRF